MTLAARDPRHGVNGYTNLGCRCDLCRAASTAARRDYVRRCRAAGLPDYGKRRSMREPCPGCGGLKDFRARQCRGCDDRERIALCGTESAYCSGCRCERCREAATAARRARRQRSAREASP